MNNKAIWKFIPILLLFSTISFWNKTTEEATARKTAVRFANIGDYGSRSEGEAAVADLINRQRVDFVTTAGDNRYGDGDFDASVGQFFCPYLTDVSIGSHCAGDREEPNAFFPSLGNHDYDDGGGVAEYLDYFTLPGADIASSHTSNNERYYDFVMEPVHFFVLDSDLALADGNDMKAQQAWLQTQLALSTTAWQVVIFHHPPYSSSARHGSNIEMQWPFANWGADAVLAGHDHIYERLDIDDIPYFVNGIGGVSFYELGDPLPGSKLLYNKAFGALFVEATTTTLFFQFINVDDEMIDSYLLEAPLQTPTSTPTIGATGNAIIPLRQATDDAEQRLDDGEMYLDGGDLELGNDFAYWGKQSIGLRFQAAPIPRDAVITAAFLEFTADESSTEETSVVFHGEAAPDADTFTHDLFDVTERPLTTHSIPWHNIPAWAAGNRYHSPDLAPILQEIISHPDWQERQDIGLIISGEGRRVAVAYDSDPTTAPRLHITFERNSSATPTSTPTATMAATNTPTQTPSITPTHTATSTVTAPPTATQTPNPTLTPTATMTPPPTLTPTPKQTFPVYLSLIKR